MQPPALAAGAPLLDAPVDRATYRLGPGDVVEIAIVGQVDRSQSATVTPEGTVIVPTLGVVRVLGLSLDAAESRVRALVLRYYRDVAVTLSLASVRSFKVFLVGNVAAPGVRAANAAMRVSELIPDDTAASVRHRNIVLRRAAGDSTLVDLARFRQVGDLSANPTLREGDALVVPTIDRTVRVYGRVRFPGVYEYRPGETLAGLLSIANGAGTFPADAADTVRVSRFSGDTQRELVVLTRAQAVGSAGALPLLPFDAIYIPALGNFRRARSATITGQVLRPGTYPIRLDTTTLSDLVAVAGGFTDEAALAEATLHRRSLENIPPRNPTQPDNNALDLLTESERRVVAARRLGDSTLVVVDFTRVFDGAAGRRQPGPRLETGDSVDVPRRRTGVAVLGAVIDPGIVPFHVGDSVDEYVRRAGGYSRRADRGRSTVLEAKYAGQVVGRDRGDVRTIMPGDQIVVPFRPPRDWLRTAQTILGTLTGLALSFYTIRQLSRQL